MGINKPTRNIHTVSVNEAKSIPELCSVFVYGTLMPGERWEDVARQGGAYQAEPARLRGAVLADLRPEGYPALFWRSDVPNAQAASEVHGWLYTYTSATWPLALPFLDELEGLELSPPLYQRLQITVQTESGPRPAWTYFYARRSRQNAAGFHLVSSGRWTDIPQRHLSGPRYTWETQETRDQGR